MKYLFLYILLFLFSGCGRQEIKKPADIIAANTKAVIFIPQLKKIFESLPSGLSPKITFYLDGFKAVLDENKAAVVAITSFDPLEAYLALPAKEGLDESLKLFLDEQLQLSVKSESWSHYVFVPLQGSLPASFGNDNFLPQNEDAVLYCKVDCNELIKGRDDQLESYKKYETLRGLRSFCSDEMNKIFTRFITHNLSDFCKDVKVVKFEMSANKLTGSLTFKADSKSAESFNSMKKFTLPEVDDKNTDLSFAASVDFSKLDFPLSGIETGFKSYLSQMKKPEAIFPMDTVFQKLRESGQVKLAGRFSVNEQTLRGQSIAIAENGEKLNESLAKFCKLMTPEFVSPFIESDSYKKYGKAFFTPAVIRGNSIKTDFRMDLDVDKIYLVDKDVENPSISLANSQEKGLLKLFMKTGPFFPFKTGIDSLKFKMTVNENEIKIQVEIQD